MRSARGIQLVEMVVAVGLSGIFVVLLSGMLSQTLSLSASSQNQVLAGAIADQYVEWIQSGSLSLNGADSLYYPLVVTFPTQAEISQTVPSLIQLDPTNQSFGTTNNGARWTRTTGSQFSGSLRLERSQVENGPAVLYTVTVFYPSNGQSKSLKRSALYYRYGASSL